jgi:hypothetical protein
MSSNAPPQPPNLPKGPPYVPTTWPLGGLNETKVDVPITAVFLFLFIIGAVTHMTIFQLNQRKGHKFLFSALLFGMSSTQPCAHVQRSEIADQHLGFCMARITTCILRIASVCLPRNIKLAIAAQVFVAAGVVIIFIVNLVFAQRMIRASHPLIGWSKPFSYFFKFCYALVVVTIIMLISVTVQSFFTLNKNTRRIDRDVQLYGVTAFAILAFLPIPMLLASLAIPRHRSLDKFGAGHWRSKPYILLIGATLICFGASFRAGTSWLTPVQRTQPLPIYYHKAFFYVVNFTVEILTVGLYAATRVDKRFHVANGASKRRSYAMYDAPSMIKLPDEEAHDEKVQLEDVPTSKSEETFNDQNTLVDAAGRRSDVGSGFAAKSMETLPTTEKKDIYSPETPVDAQMPPLPVRGSIEKTSPETAVGAQTTEESNEVHASEAPVDAQTTEESNVVHTPEAPVDTHTTEESNEVHAPEAPVDTQTSGESKDIHAPETPVGAETMGKSKNVHNPETTADVQAAASSTAESKETNSPETPVGAETVGESKDIQSQETSAEVQAATSSNAEEKETHSPETPVDAETTTSPTEESKAIQDPEPVVDAQTSVTEPAPVVNTTHEKKEE